MIVAPVYQASPIKRRRRTEAQIEQLERQIADVLRQDHPQSVRHVTRPKPRPEIPPEKRELRTHLNDDIELVFDRLAVRRYQIQAYDLPTKPRNPNDKRSPHVTETVEAEAIPAGILRRLLRGRIEAFLPADALAVARAAEESERACLGRLAGLTNLGEAPDGGAR